MQRLIKTLQRKYVGNVEVFLKYSPTLYANFFSVQDWDHQIDDTVYDYAVAN